MDAAITEAHMRAQTQRLVFRCVSQYLRVEVRALMVRHAGDLGRALIWLAVAQASGGLDPALAGRPSRSIAVRALSRSLDFPYETTRRKVLALERAGWIERDADQAIGATPQALLREVRFSAAATCATFRQLIADLRAIDFDPARFVPEAPARPPPGEAGEMVDLRAAVLLDGFMLRVFEAALAPHGSILGAIVYTALMLGNAAPITNDPLKAWRYAGADTPPPDQERTPMTLVDLAASVAMPRETIRRELVRLQAAGRCRREPGGYLLDMAHLQSPEILTSGLVVSQRFLQLVQALGQIGFSLNEPATRD